MSEYLQEAFNQVVKDAIQAETWYVTLMLKTQHFGGREEGGWWYDDYEVISYKDYPSEEIARKVAAKVRTMAEELSRIAQREHGEQCLREMEWLDARGLDADWLPEPDGPDKYIVEVSQELPQSSSGYCHYE